MSPPPSELERKALKSLSKTAQWQIAAVSKKVQYRKLCLPIRSALHQSGDICICSRIGYRMYRKYTARKSLFRLSVFFLAVCVSELIGLELCSLVLDYLRLYGISKEILHLTCLPLPPSGHLLFIFSLSIFLTFLHGLISFSLQASHWF